MKALNRACRIAYELSLLGTFLLCVLAPIHASFTQHFTVMQTIDASHAKITGDVSTLSPGAYVNLYRFHSAWKSKLGSGLVESVSNGEAFISVDPAKMAWPLGIQGQISRGADGGLSLSAGSRLGIQSGHTLNIFEGRNLLGHVKVLEVGAENSTIAPAPFLQKYDLRTLVASRFTVATQATFFQNDFLSGLEIFLVLFFLFVYIFAFLRTRESPFILASHFLKRIPLPQRAVFWSVNILAGVPFVWFMSQFPVQLVLYILKNVFHSSFKMASLVDTTVLSLYVIIGICYYAFLFWSRRSPILAFWNLFSYRKMLPQKNSQERRFLLWALYLIVIYAFASTLIGFLRGDIAAMRQIGWPAPSQEATFEFLKYGVWSLTVIGCLVGYGHSLVSILWGKYVRNLDFTIVGWLTNGLCYPLFGVMIWRITPSFIGLDPIITDGPLQLLMFWMGFFLNIFYMLTIWNLGTMFGLMADKGVRTWGFYSVVRHPSYMLEVLMFAATGIVGFSGGVQWLSISMYFFLYWIRSEREDNFMAHSNPKYLDYQKETRDKFIPGVY